MFKRDKKQKDHPQPEKHLQHKPPVSQEEKDITVPEFKLTKKNAKQSESKPSQPKKHIPPHKIFGTLLALIMVTILTVVGSMLYESAFKPNPIAKYLPADKTAAFLEINTNFDHTQIEKAKNLLAKTEYSFDKLSEMLKEKFSTDLIKEASSWLGRQIGIAEILPDENKNNLETIYFIETLSAQASQKTLSTLAENNLSKLNKVSSKGYELYSFSLRYPGDDRTKDKKIYISFLDDYLIASESNEAINVIMTGKSNQNNKVVNDKQYQNIENAMSINRVAFIYINFKKAKDLLLQKYGVSNTSPLLAYTIHPFSDFFNSEGAVLIALDQSFEIQSFLNFDENYFQGNGDIMYIEPYQATLSNYVPDNISAFFGGKNLEKQLKRVIAVLGNNKDVNTTMLDNAVKSYMQKYFGNGVTLEDDIAPLIENEFAIYVSEKDKKNIYTIILDLKDASAGEASLQKLANNFVSYGTVFEPHVEEHTLPDGTKTKEIVATQETLIKSDSKYGSYVVHEMKTEKGDWGIYYSVAENAGIGNAGTGNVGIISTDKNSLIDSLKLAANENQNSLKKSKIFALHIQPVLSYSDEVSYFDISKFWPNSKLVKSLSEGKEYSFLGIMSYYYLYVE